MSTINSKKQLLKQLPVLTHHNLIIWSAEQSMHNLILTYMKLGTIHLKWTSDKQNANTLQNSYLLYKHYKVIHTHTPV